MTDEIEIVGDGEPVDVEAYVQNWAEKVQTIHDLREQLALARSENERLQNLVERLKGEAEIHAQEARCQTATVNEIYQICTDGKGEPGNWHGAEPVRELRRRLADAEARAGGAVEIKPAERELLCQRCSMEHPVWFTPNRLWNHVTREDEHFLCPTCFISLAEARGYVPQEGWMLDAASALQGAEREEAWPQ